MVYLECEHEGENKVNKKIDLQSGQGCNILLKDEQGEILNIQCSCQPGGTAIRLRIFGEISVEMDGDKFLSKNDKVIIRRV